MTVEREQRGALDAACWSVWAKSGRDDGRVSAWLPLYQHLDDTAGVAGLLVDQWVSPQVIARVARDVPGGGRGVRSLAVWLASTHDIGKASPAFAVQVEKFTPFMIECGLGMSLLLAKDPQRRRVNHALVGHLATRGWLAEELGFPRRGLAAALASVIGSHHGVPPERGAPAEAARRLDLVGSGLWGQVREALLRRATERLGGLEVLRAYQQVTLELPSQVLLTAVVILADWIASNPDFFPLWPLSTLHQPPAPDESLTARRLATGWELLNLPPRWHAARPGDDVAATVRARFDLPAARPVQTAAVQVAIEQPEPGLIVIEAPMGEGKTEAALLAAEVLAYRTGADGCFIALPTQATSDAMFERVTHWLDRLPGRADGAKLSVRLAHGKAHLNDTFAGLVRRGRFGSVGEGAHEELVAHQWLSGRKKGVLASFVVGTVDQLLFAALRSRHLMLRHLALAGKVVVIDEVHAYDVYMSQYLQRTLHWLGAYRVPVVLLSATLPSARRAALVAAYESGRDSAPRDLGPMASGYPMISGSGVPPRHVPAARGNTPVTLDHLPDDLDSLVGYLRARLAEGGCAAVIRNTVTRVQETARRLAAEFGAEQVTVDHARFLSCDRARIDRGLVATFGPSSADRPTLHIVVGSQVLEQSLDVDFDLMVTDLAPADLVLQRVGRLHRHDRERPGPLREARCALVGVEDWAQEPVVPTAGSQRVYGSYPLLRSAALLVDRDIVNLPGDIAPLVESAYGSDEVGPPSWQPALRTARAAAERDARERAEAASAFLLDEVGPAGRDLVGWVSAGVGDLDDDHRGRAQVRDGEETLEVLVVQQDGHDGLLTPSWIERGGGQQIPLDLEMPWPVARTIASCTLRLPLALSHPGVIDQTIKALEPAYYPSFQQTPLLAGQLVLVLDENCQTRLRLSTGEFELTYDPAWGLLHERR